jgi:flagellar hook-associated protein 2
LLQADQIPITNLQNQSTDLSNQLTVIQEYQAAVQAVGSAAQALDTASAFNPITSSSSDQTVATITTTSGASAGTYNLTISQLAQAEKLSSSAQQDSTTALGLSGTIVVNGQGIQIGSGDNLTTIAQKINGTNSGVTASIISGGSGNNYLTLTANNSGVANKVQIADLQGTVAGSLGLIGGTATARSASNGADLGYTFSSQSDNLNSLLNASNLGTASFSINGVNVSVDTTSTTLQGLVSAINTANTGATASIVTGTNATGGTTYQLKLTGATSFTDGNNLLQGVGVLQQGYSNEVLGAQDAKYSLDNINLTSSSNTITNVIQGSTIQLLKGTTAAPGTTTIALAQDTSTVSTTVQSFVTAYNNLNQFVAQNSALDTSTYQTGPLFGDPNVQQIQSTLASDLFTPVPGLAQPYNNLSSIGLAFDQNGNLTFDSTQLTAALTSNPTAVQNLFTATGSSSAPAISYIASTTKTVPSGSGQYAVNITQAATQGSFTASTAQTGPLANNELLTFNGPLFSNSNAVVLLQAGETQQDVVNQINSDATLKNDVIASVQNGNLVITSQKYGTNGNFTLSSDTAASGTSSGLGGGTVTNGLDVAGTINGEAATGNGQYLTGNSGNAKTDGLQISYNGTATGQVGSISFTNGVGSILNNAITNFTDPTTGLVTADENTINTQIADIAKQVTQLQTAMTNDQAQLQTEFANMESAIANLQNQQKQLNAELGTTSSTSSSTA